ncbi:MAG: hypothetical protein FWH17_03605 [Oscillospiraceae bacterium]|nr:hypothetical protein [Oscillospiraceae bacterium]
MQAQAYEGYFEHGQFYPIGQIQQTDKRFRALLTVLGESVHTDIVADAKKSSREWLDEFFALLGSATTELHEEDFTRLQFSRALINFDDEV